MQLAQGECWFDVIVLFAGLTVPTKLELTPNVCVEQIFEANLVAQAVQTASEVTLGLPSNPDEPMHPICGLRYRLRGRRPIEATEYRRNAELIEAPKRAFIRAVALIRGLELLHGGTFVYEEDHAGHRRIQSWQFNAGILSVHYDAAYFRSEHGDELRRVYTALCDPYMGEAGASIGTAIDRLGVAGTRLSPLDTNLDLCIAAEIAFLFGLQDRIENEKITEAIRDNARCFFGDDEFFFDRETVFQIVQTSYQERGKTIHGRKGDHRDRYDVLITANAQLRAVLKASLRAYVERKPTKALARPLWAARVAALAERKPLGPIFT